MKIQRISIKNYRCYYGDNTFEIGENLTLIIGAGGVGKTAFFEALRWLFDIEGMMRANVFEIISYKRCTELLDDESDNVSVSMSYEQNNSFKIYEKSVRFSKTVKGEIISSTPSVKLCILNGREHEYIEGKDAFSCFNCDFALSFRKYCLFTRDEYIDILNNKKIFSYLVDSSSQVRDFDHYLALMKFAKINSVRAADQAMKADKFCRKEAERLRNLISQEEKVVGDKTTERNLCLEEACNYKNMLDDTEQFKEGSKLFDNHYQDDWSKLRTKAQTGFVKAQERADLLNREIEHHQTLLNQYEEQYSLIAEDSSAAKYFRASKVISKIYDAFVSAKNKNRRDFLYILEKETNNFFEAFNKGVFYGNIKFNETTSNIDALRLVNKNDGVLINNLSLAMKRMMCFSLIFALSRIMFLNGENTFPLFFDCQTLFISKERDFFEVVRKFNQQAIFAEYCSEFELPYYADINAKIYRLELDKSFDPFSPASIQTKITELN